MPIDFDDIDDFAINAVDAIGRYRQEFILSPEQISGFDYPADALEWHSIPYGEERIGDVPDDRRGIYAFAICSQGSALPPHCYVLYIGIAGRKSDRSLRDRYRDYLNAKKILRRERIARMIGSWRSVLRFYYAPVEPEMTSEELEELERQLNGALLPPMSEGDLEATIKAQRRAFR
jgi:hypothetical protein